MNRISFLNRGYAFKGLLAVKYVAVELPSCVVLYVYNVGYVTFNILSHLFSRTSQYSVFYNIEYMFICVWSIL